MVLRGRARTRGQRGLQQVQSLGDARAQHALVHAVLAEGLEVLPRVRRPKVVIQGIQDEVVPHRFPRSIRRGGEERIERGEPEEARRVGMLALPTEWCIEEC